MPGATLTVPEKLCIAKALASLGVSSLDAGFPACAPDEIEAIRQIVREVPGVVISALCRAVSSDIDRALEALEEAEDIRRAVSIFLATSSIHRERKLFKSKAEVCALAVDSIQYARRHFCNVAFSPEDASRTEIDFLAEIYTLAIDAGATVIGFTDTLGILTPESTRSFVRQLQDRVPNISRAAFAVHFHDDLGLATANTLAAVAEGVHIVQCTINGIGERAGNAALEEVAMAVLLNPKQYGRQTKIDPRQLRSVSQLVARLTSSPLAPNKAIVGANIFATEAGIHQDGLLKDPDTYLPFRPEMLGEHGIQLILGKHSGTAAVDHRLRELGYTLEPEQLRQVMVNTRLATRDQWKDDAVLLTELARKALLETPPQPATSGSNLHVHYSAELYHRYTTSFVGKYDELMIASLRGSPELLDKPGILLDIGAGTGTLLIRLAQDEQFRNLALIGIDYFSDMVATAKEAIDKANLADRIDFIEADVHDMPFPSSSIDLALSRSTLHHWADQVKAFQEIYRCLAPGGLALIHDVRRDPNPRVLAEFNQARARAGVEPCRLEEKLTAQEVLQILHKAGLADQATLIAEESGPGALGFEVCLRKPRDTSDAF
jgi:2-isopropylmalate synthase